MSPGQFDQITAQISSQGGEVVENFSDEDVKWFSLLAAMTDDVAESVVKNPVLDSMTLDVVGWFVENTPEASSITSRSPSSGQDSVGATTAMGNSSFQKRALEDIEYFQFDPPEEHPELKTGPLHLQWLTNLWAVNNLKGSCKYSRPPSS
jgi:hypothetical protein